MVINMPIITVGRLRVEQTKLNANNEDRWMRGTIDLYGRCRSLLSEIGQRKLPFTMVTGKMIPKEPMILLGEITTYRIPNSNVDWKTLEIRKFIPQNSPLLKELDCSFITAVRKIADNDEEFLQAIGGIELTVRKKIQDLVGSKNRFADHMIEHFGDHAYDKLIDNPWRMINIIPYFTITHADNVAEKLGIPLTDDRRFPEYFRYLMDQAFESHRNTYMSENEFMAFYWMHFSDSMTVEEFRNLTRKRNSPVIKTELGYHPAHFYWAEDASYRIIQKSMEISIPMTRKEEWIIEQVLAESPIQLSDEQLHALREAFHSSLHVITGGPGTGKTTVLNTILRKLALLTGRDFDEQCPYLLVAPTGKAAYRMYEQTGIIAHTIHSAFGIIPEYGCLDIEETANRLSHVRYLIIDESSMLDTKLFGDLCRVLLQMDHIPFLLLVGDIDQLPPVQHGQVFRDLVLFVKKHAAEHLTCLTLLKRQANGSHIPELAAYIKDGTFPDLEWFEDKNDIFFVPSTMETFQKQLVENVLAPKKDELDTIQILTPYRNGTTPDTVHMINKIVKPLYNAEMNGNLEKSIICAQTGQILHVGDKVINRANRTKTIINGSLGEIVEIHNHSKDIFSWSIDVMFENGEEDNFSYEDSKWLELAYAITIHASQGSEYPNVVMCAMRGSSNADFLNRNLLYVGVTRAAKKLVLIGQIENFRQIAATKQRPRHTALAYWLENRKGKNEWEC